MRKEKTAKTFLCLAGFLVIFVAEDYFGFGYFTYTLLLSPFIDFRRKLSHFFNSGNTSNRAMIIEIAPANKKSGMSPGFLISQIPSNMKK